MGVWVELLIAPASGRLTSVAFNAFVADLIEQRIVSLPCAILEGNIDDTSALGVVNVVTGASSASGVTLTYKGDNVNQFFEALHRVAFGQVDFCVWFEGLDGKNRQLWQQLEKEGCHYNADVVIYALRQPQTITIIDAYEGECSEHSLMHYIMLTGKSGPHTIAGTMIESLVAKHFGRNFLVDCSYT